MKVKESFSRIVDEIRDMSERAAMGLPERYLVPDAESLTHAGIELTGMSASELVTVVENPAMPRDLRLAAALLLGIVGDPRVRPLDPSMVTITGGEVYIGVDAERVDRIVAANLNAGVKREWIEKEVPRHKVHLAQYRIGKYLVTNAEFAAFLQATGHDEIPTSWAFGRFHPAFSNHPVHTVSDVAAQAYCDWLSAQTGRRFRLPTEAEWEYAAAGPDGREFPWGDFAEDCANTLESGLLMPTPIGCFPKGVSYFGAFDMAGNVEEWTSDFYAPYCGGNAVCDDLADLAAPQEGRYRVCRGGAFTRFQDLARCQRRHGPVGVPLYPISFRLVEECSHA